MLEELKKFIFEEYAAKNRPIDEEYYRGIVTIFSKYHGLSKYVQKVEFRQIGNGANAAYNYSAGQTKIIIDRNRINKESIEICKRFSNKFSTVENESFKYIYSARAILHELIHAVQNRNSERKSIESIESLSGRVIAKLDPYQIENICYVSNKYGRNILKEKYEIWEKYKESTYGCDLLHERDAEVQSYSMVVTMLRYYKDVYSNIEKYMKANFYTSLLMGYKIKRGDIISPTYLTMKFLSENDMVDPRGTEWFCSNLNKATQNAFLYISNPSERFTIGMQVTPQEYMRVLGAYKKFDDEGYIIGWYALKNDPVDPEL